MGTDAVKWAEQWEEYCKILHDEKGDPYPDHIITTGWMVSWFANAIEAGRSAGQEANMEAWSTYDEGYQEGFQEGFNAAAAEADYRL